MRRPGERRDVGADPGVLQPTVLSDILYSVLGVSVQERGDDPATVINIRGLQTFGRVAVVVDGARQNYQRTGHNANGLFFLDPELVGGVDGARPDREHLRLRRDWRRGLVPHQGHQRRAASRRTLGRT